MSNPYKHMGSGRPYNDTFNPEKNYNRVMFRPGVAVQARELTESQSILQNQISAHAGYMLKDGSATYGGKISFGNKAYCLRADLRVYTAEAEVKENNPEFFIGRTFIGQSSRQKIIIEKYELAKVFNVSTNSLEDQHILYFNYLGGNIDESGETFISEANTTFQYKFNLVPNSVKIKYIASCTPGIIFNNGYFITIPNDPKYTQVILGDKLEAGINEPPVIYSIGFKVVSRFIDAGYDTSLNDNAAGFTNYNAPGADRLHFHIQLFAFEGTDISKIESFYNDELKDSEGNDIPGIISRQYIQGIVIENGKIIKEQDDPLSGSTILDTLAQRTYDESGNYTVNPWKIYIQNNLSDPNYYNIAVQEGSGYVKGYNVRTISETIVSNIKPEASGLTKYITTQLDTSGGFYFLTGNNGPLVSTSIFPSINERVAILSKYVDFNALTSEEIDEEIANYCIGVGYVKAYKKDSQSLKIYLYNLEIGDPNSAKSLVVIQNETLRKARVFNTGKTYNVATPVKYIHLYSGHNYGGYEAPLIYPIQSNSQIKNIDSDSIEYHASIEYKEKCTSVVSNNETTYQITIQDSRVLFDTSDASLIGIFDLGLTGTEDPIQIQTNSITKKLQQTNYGNTKYILSTTESDILKENHIYQIFLETRVFFTKDERSYRQKELYRAETTIYNVTPESYTTERDSKDEEKRVLFSETNNSVLLVEDIFRIISVTLFKNPNDIQGEDITDRCILDNGQRDWCYDIGRIILPINEITLPVNESSVSIRIVYDHFTVSNTVAGPFVVNSYRGDASISDKEMYEKIGTYQATNGIEYSLRNCLDFRPYISEINNRSYPARYNSIIPNSELFCEFTKYLPRYDILYVNSQGSFGIVNGIPSENPTYPVLTNDSMALYYIQNPSYVLDIKEIKAIYIPNSHYTMNDIAKIDKRLKNVEDSLSLTQLEIDAMHMHITDNEGLDRYKTGIFTDAFTGFSNADYKSKYWNCNFDAIEQSCRANFNSKNIPFELDTNKSSNVSFSDIGIYITPIGIEIYAQNTFMSETTNIQKMYFFVWEGNLKLYPSIDTWVTDLGNIVKEETYIDTPEPVKYKSWTTLTNQIVNHDYTQDWGFGLGHGKQWQTTYQAQIEYISSYSKVSVTEQMESQDEYMREKIIDFTLEGFRPGTRISASINNEPIEITSLYQKDDKNLTLPINAVIPENGAIGGTLKIPGNKIPVGTKTIKIIDDSNTSSAEATYTATGRTIWNNVYNTYLREWAPTSNLKNQTITSQKWVNYDPIAQSIFIENPGGVYLESFEVYFAKKDPNTGVYIYILEMKNGYPDYESIVPYSRVYLDSNKVIVPYTSNTVDYVNKPLDTGGDTNLNKNYTSTKFKFDMPVYLEGNKEYAFVIASTSYLYEVYTSTLGKPDLNTLTGIYEQPYAGSLFVSQNSRTWSAQQQTDLAFKLNVYKFDTNSQSEIYFSNSDFMEIANGTIVINSVIPNNTNIELYYSTSNTYVPLTNYANIDFQNAITASEFTIKVIAKTSDPYLTPIIDNEQIYGIFTNNLLSEISADGDLYDAGTYISKTTTLINESQDFRLIIDAVLPNGSYIEPYVKTTSFLPCYIEQSNIEIVTNVNENLSDSQISEYSSEELKRQLQECNESQLQVFYNTPLSTEEATGINSLNNETVRVTCEKGKLYHSPSSTVQMSGYDIEENNRNIVYLIQVGNSSSFYTSDENINGEEHSYGNAVVKNDDGDDLTITDVLLVKTNITTDIDIQYWNEYIEYHPNDFVFYNKKIWKALEQIGRTGNMPHERSICWEEVPFIRCSSTIKQKDKIEWRKLELQSGSNNYSNKETQFNEYSYKPRLLIAAPFVSFSVMIKMFSKDKINIPRLKNLRCIATL